MISAELARLFQAAACIPDSDPPSLDEVLDLIDESSDTRLALLCRSEPGEPAPHLHKGVQIKSLSYSSQLRRRLVEEIDEIQLKERRNRYAEAA